MSRHYGDFHIVEKDDGVEINSMSDFTRWVLVPYDVWRAILKDYYEVYVDDHDDPIRPTAH